MSVIPLTIFFSLLLAGLFIALFVHEQRRRRFTSAEHDSLLPLAEETSREAGGARAPSRASTQPARSAGSTSKAIASVKVTHVPAPKVPRAAAKPAAPAPAIPAPVAAKGDDLDKFFQ